MGRMSDGAPRGLVREVPRATMPTILHVTTVDPPYGYTSAEIAEGLRRLWLPELEPALRRRAEKLLYRAEIAARRGVVPLDVVLAGHGLRERNALYSRAMIDLGTEALRRALEESGTAPSEIGAVITTSCTGIMIPSVDAYLVDRLALRTDVLRLPVTEMGCAGGTAGLIYARDIARARPGTKVALLALEAPSLTFLRDDHSVENLVSAAIFADGVACVLVGGEGDVGGAEIADADMYHFPQSTYLMGYELRDDGFKIVLDRDVPSAIRAHFPRVVHPFLARNGLTPEGVDHYLFHPGGKRILHMMEDFAMSHGRDVADSRYVLETRGNMSSATVLHVLERTSRRARSGEVGYMLAFGPGFTAQSLLLRFGGGAA